MERQWLLESGAGPKKAFGLIKFLGNSKLGRVANTSEQTEIIQGEVERLETWTDNNTMKFIVQVTHDEITWL